MLIPRIVQFCLVRNASVELNGKQVFSEPDTAFEQFAENAYKHFAIRYPKFYKMDNLCKLAFIAAELTLAGQGWEEKYDPYKTGINLLNENSSIDTDIKYNDLLKKGIASPAIFVYSLPNIMVGEICIRHNIKGDNLLFISDEYNTKMQHQYSSVLLDTGIVDALLSGRVDFCSTGYEAFIYTVEKSEDTSCLEFTQENLEHLYKNTKWNYSN
jgi:hypothetical protein